MAYSASDFSTDQWKAGLNAGIFGGGPVTAPPTWQYVVDQWRGPGGGSGQLASNWNDPKFPNAKTQFDALYNNVYQPLVTGWNAVHPDQPVEMTAQDAAFNAPVAHNPGLVGTGGGVLGGGLGSILKVVVPLVLAGVVGPEVLAGFGAEGAAAGEALGGFGGLEAYGAAGSMAGAAGEGALGSLVGGIGADTFGASDIAQALSLGGENAGIIGTGETGLSQLGQAAAAGGVGSGGLGLSDLSNLPTSNPLGNSAPGGSTTTAPTGSDANGNLTDANGTPYGPPSSSTAGGTVPDSTTIPSGTSTTAQSVLSRIMDGTATDADWLKLGGTAGSTLASIFNANNAQSQFTDLANQSRADRQPFLDYAKTSLAGGPEAWAAGPGAGALKGILSGLSVKGNPFGDPGALIRGTAQASDGWMKDYSTAANLGLGGQETRANLAAAGINAGTGTLSSLARGVSDLTNPTPSLSDYLKMFNSPGLA